MLCPRNRNARPFGGVYHQLELFWRGSSAFAVCCLKGVVQREVRGSNRCGGMATIDDRRALKKRTIGCKLFLQLPPLCIDEKPNNYLFRLVASSNGITIPGMMEVVTTRAHVHTHTHTHYHCFCLFGNGFLLVTTAITFPNERRRHIKEHRNSTTGGRSYTTLGNPLLLNSLYSTVQNLTLNWLSYCPEIGRLPHVHRCPVRK